MKYTYIYLLVFYFILGCDSNSDKNLTFLEKYDGSVWSHPNDDFAERIGFYNSTSTFFVAKDVSGNSSWCETYREGYDASNDWTLIIEENTSERLKIKVLYSGDDEDEDVMTFTVSGNNVLILSYKETYDNGATVYSESYTYTLLPDESNLHC